MNTRILALVSGLVAVLLAAGFYLLLWQPKSDEVADLEEQAATLQTQQAQLTGQIARLQAVRREAPDIEAQLAAAEAVIPRSAALPVFVRQMQQAADDSGVTLLSLSPGAPSAVADGPAGLATIGVTANVTGGYFQLVDFLRRLEDPAITARGFLWSSAGVAPSEYPTLSLSLSGQMFAYLPGAPTAPPPPPEPNPSETATEVVVEVEE